MSEQHKNSAEEQLKESYREAFSVIEPVLKQKYSQIKTRNIDNVRDIIEKVQEQPPFRRYDLYVAEKIWIACDGEVQGKRILDLGCGANALMGELELEKRSETEWALNGDKIRTHEPWGCRALHEMGADVVGVDIGNLDGEEFEHHQIDIFKKNSLSQFPDHSFDVIHCNTFLASPTLLVRGGEFSFAYIFKNHFLPQLWRLLKPNGKLLIENHPQEELFAIQPIDEEVERHILEERKRLMQLPSSNPRLIVDPEVQQQIDALKAQLKKYE